MCKNWIINCGFLNYKIYIGGFFFKLNVINKLKEIGSNDWLI